MRAISMGALLALTVPLAAQNLDSLWGIWNDAQKPDTVRLKALEDLAWDGFLFTKPDSALILAELGEEFAHERGRARFEANAIRIQGAALTQLERYQESLERHKRALPISIALKDSSGMASAYVNSGIDLKEMGRYAEAISYYSNALAIADRRQDKRAQASCLLNMSNIYGNLHDLRNALDYSERSLTLMEELQDKKGLADVLGNLAGLYAQSGDTARALEYMVKDVTICEEIRDGGGLSNALNNLGSLYLGLGEVDQALAVFERGLSVSREMGREFVSATCLIGLSKVAESKGDKAKAIDLAVDALSIGKRIGAVMVIGRASERLYGLYKRAGNVKAALAMHELYVQMRDSIASEENIREAAVYEMKYAYKKDQLADSLEHVAQLAFAGKEKALAQLHGEEQRNRAYALGVIAVLLLAGVVLFLVQDRKRRFAQFRASTAQLETQALRSQMNPHFIFNALNSISAYVQKNEPDKAVGYLGKFARLMRLVLENSRQSEVPLKDDIEALDAYLHLERARGGEKFDYSINVDPAIDQEETLVPPLVIQPFVENAIWHGMAGKEGKGHITLSVTRRADELVMAIEDDGVGRHTPKKVLEGEPVKKTSLATTITQARLDLVQKQKGRPAGFKYIDLPQGTRVEVSLPISEAA